MVQVSLQNLSLCSCFLKQGKAMTGVSAFVFLHTGVYSMDNRQVLRG